MRNTMWMVAFASLVLCAGSTRAADREPDPALLASVRGCAQGSGAACRDLASHLATRFKGITPADRALGSRLGVAAARAIQHPDGTVSGVAESCRVGYRAACATLANVLDHLFAGDDARLERSTDRLLAHDLAVSVVDARAQTAISFQGRR
jgi:hypothetical protein